MSTLVRCKRRAQGWAEEGTVHEKEDLRSLSAPVSQFGNVSFSSCDMGLANLTGSIWKNSSAENCRLPLVSLSAAQFDGVSLYECDFEQASFAGAVLRDVNFVRCRLSYSTFAGATLRRVNFIGSNLHGADLDCIETEETSFSDCNLWGVKAAFGCAFFGCTFDERSANYFAALVGVIHPNPSSGATINALAGQRAVRAVERLMARGGKGEEEAGLKAEDEAPAGLLRAV